MAWYIQNDKRRKPTTKNYSEVKKRQFPRHASSSSARSAIMAMKTPNSKAEVAWAQAALAVNIRVACRLHDILRTHLGPKGTMKMLVSGAGDIKLTKDGNVLLHEMVRGSYTKTSWFSIVHLTCGKIFNVYSQVGENQSHHFLIGGLSDSGGSRKGM